MSNEPPNATLVLRLRVPNFQSDRNIRGVRSKKGLSMIPCVPSWNDMLALDEWGRRRLKWKIADAFLYALRELESCSTKTTSVRKSASIFADTLAAYQMTVLVKRRSRQRNARQKKAKKITP